MPRRLRRSDCSIGLRSDLVEQVILPRALAQDNLEFLRREDRLLVLEHVLDRDPRACGVHPRIDAVAPEEVRGYEIHQVDVRLSIVLLRKGLQVRGQAHPFLANLPGYDESKYVGIPGSR